MDSVHRIAVNGVCALLDVNSGAVHLIDRLTFDLLATFDGDNDGETVEAWRSTYDEREIRETLAELHTLIDAGQLFSADIVATPGTFAEVGVVKSLCLMVAQDCNLRCRYCFGGDGQYGDRELMSADTGRRAVDYLIARSGARQHLELDFFGGEPLVNLGVVRDITAYARQRERETGKRIKLTLTTNGLLLNDEARRFLNDNDFSAVLSLDGRQPVHDRMRPDAAGHGTYDRVLANFRAFVRSRGNDNYYLRGTYTRHNLDFAADVAAMFDAGFNIVSVEPVVARDTDYALTESDLPAICAEYDRLTAYYLRERPRGLRFFHFELDLDDGPCLAKRLAGCGAGHEYLAVAANGDLYPCHQFVGRDAFRMGDVNVGVTRPDLPPKFRNAHVLAKATCRGCWARFYCSGGCHANAVAMSGDLREPWPLGCAIQRKRLECAIVVQALLRAQRDHL